MNLLLLVLLVLLICNVVGGYQKGMVKSIISLVSLVALCVVAALITVGLQSYNKGEIINVVIAVLLLCLLGIVQHLLNMVFFSAKMISKLPVVHSLDKLLGIVVGILETVFLLWTVYAFIQILDLGIIEKLIVDATAESKILTWFYEHNRLAVWVEGIATKIM